MADTSTGREDAGKDTRKNGDQSQGGSSNQQFYFKNSPGQGCFYFPSNLQTIYEQRLAFGTMRILKCMVYPSLLTHVN